MLTKFSSLSKLFLAFCQETQLAEQCNRHDVLNSKKKGVIILVPFLISKVQILWPFFHFLDKFLKYSSTNCFCQYSTLSNPPPVSIYSVQLSVLFMSLCFHVFISEPEKKFWSIFTFMLFFRSTISSHCRHLQVGHLFISTDFLFLPDPQYPVTCDIYKLDRSCLSLHSLRQTTHLLPVTNRPQCVLSLRRYPLQATTSHSST